MKQLNNQKGFTLVEIAIVMVIIGLLLGGVLKGQQMIANAKIKSLADHARGLAAAAYAYQERYRALPGDDLRATINLPGSGNGCAAGTLINGNGNGQILGAERFAAAEHLACAGLITGTYDGTTQHVPSPYGGTAIIAFANPFQGRVGNYIVYNNLPADVAQAWDTMADDGVFDTGAIRASAAYAPTTLIANTGYFY